MLNRKFFSSIASNVVARYRKHIFDPAGGGKKAKQVTGIPYPSTYSDKYSIAKKSAKLKRSDSKFSKSNAPVLTGDLLRDFQGFNLISGGFRFGTPTQGGKVQNLTRLGRVIATDKNPLPKEVDKYVMSQADKYVKKELKKIKGKKINIKI
tara:strand:+ start:3972 stop:4424 length:453 start_codon:yes stop_codon:yes gene_type:complete